jgi:type VI secretion system protein ImpG
MDHGDDLLHNQVKQSNFALFCTPAINLFPKRPDRIHVSDRKMEFHVVPDRTQPLGFEVYQVTQVEGLETANDEGQVFWPLYSCSSPDGAIERPSGYFVVRRERRSLSERERRSGPRTDYRGCEMFLSLVDTEHPPYNGRLQQLSIDTLCTNRDVPVLLDKLGKLDFNLDSGEPVKRVTCLTRPTPPRPSFAEGELAWRLVSHLTLNYLSLSNTGSGGAKGLQSLLKLYSDSNDRRVQQQVEAVTSVVCTPIVDYLPSPGPPAIGRGLEVSLTFDEDGFRGTGCYLLACVLEHFFAKYVSVNTFTQTVLHTLQRGEIKRWPVRIGSRQTI